MSRPQSARRPPTAAMVSSFSTPRSFAYNFLNLNLLQTVKRKDLKAAQAKRVAARPASARQAQTSMLNTPRNPNGMQKKDYPAVFVRAKHSLPPSMSVSALGAHHWDVKKAMARQAAPVARDPTDIVFKVGAINESLQRERLSQYKLQAELEHKMKAFYNAGSRNEEEMSARRERKIVQMAVRGSNPVGLIAKQQQQRPFSARQFARASAVRYPPCSSSSPSSPSSPGLQSNQPCTATTNSYSSTVATSNSSRASTSGHVLPESAIPAASHSCTVEAITGAWTKKLPLRREEKVEATEDEEEEVVQITSRSVEEILAEQDERAVADEATRQREAAEMAAGEQEAVYSTAPSFEQAESNAVWLWPSGRTKQPVVEEEKKPTRKRVVRRSKPPPARTAASAVTPRAPIPGQDISAPAPKRRALRRRKPKPPSRQPVRPSSSPMMRELPSAMDVIDARFSNARKAMVATTYGRVNANQRAKDLEKSFSPFSVVGKQVIAGQNTVARPLLAPKRPPTNPRDRPQSAVPKGKPRTRADAHKPHARPQTARIHKGRPSASAHSSSSSAFASASSPGVRVASVRPQTARSRAARVNDRVMIEDIRASLLNGRVAFSGRALDHALLAPHVSMDAQEKAKILPGAMSERLLKNPYSVPAKKKKRKKGGKKNKGAAWRFKKKSSTSSSNQGVFSKLELKRMNDVVMAISEQKADAMFRSDWLQVAEGLSTDIDIDAAANVKDILQLYHPKIQFVFNVYCCMTTDEVDASVRTLPFPVFLQLMQICEIVDKIVTPSKLEELFVRVVDPDEVYLRSTEPCKDEMGNPIFERCPPYYDAEYGLTRAQFMEVLVRTGILKMHGRPMYVADSADKSTEAILRDFVLPRAVQSTTVRSAMRRRFVSVDVAQVFIAVHRPLWKLFYSHCQADKKKKKFLLQSEAEALLHAEFQVDFKASRAYVGACGVTDLDKTTGQVQLSFACFLEVITRLADGEVGQDTPRRSANMELDQQIVNFLAVSNRFEQYRSQTLIAGSNLL
jgi:hypothetical protein